MDRLAMNAMLARQAGMTYGKWKALQPVVPVEKKIPDGWLKCEECGEPFAPKNGKRFCDEGCRRRSYDKRKNQKKAEYMRQYRAAKKEGAEDGK